MLGRSKYLGFLATLVLGYGLCIAMTEGAARTNPRQESNGATPTFAVGMEWSFCGAVCCFGACLPRPFED